MSTAQTCQNIIIGAGHNGLTCAAYLARAGQSVLVLEAHSDIGGAACTRELAAGVRVSPAAHLLHAMSADLIAELALERHGLEFSAKALPTISLHESGQSIVLTEEGVQGESVSGEDRAAYLRFRQDMQGFIPVLGPVFDTLPPELAIESWRQKLDLLGIGWRLRRLGRQRMREFMRIIGMNLYDLLDEYIANPQLKAAIAMDALLGSEWGARSMGSVMTYLYRLAGYERSGGLGLALPRGGMGTVSLALANAAREAGAVIATDSKVRQILIENDRAVGVKLIDGEQLRCDRVISNADPKQTFLRLISPDHLDTGFVRQVKNLRCRGRAGKLHLVLKGLPSFTGVDVAALGARLLIAPNPDDIELAFNPCKYGRYPEAAVLELTLPSLNDSNMANDGQHVLSAVVQYLPYDDTDNENDNRASMLETLIAQLESYAPGIRALITTAELLTPRDIEREFGISGGHWHHVELVLEALLVNRPTPDLSRHETPIAGLYLCGAACHPGGNVMGIAGRNAATVVLQRG